MSIKRFDQFNVNELSAGTIITKEQSAKERFKYHRKNIDKFMKEIHAGIAKLEKDQSKRGEEEWTNIGTMSEIATQLNDLNNFINGKEEEYL